MRRRELTLLIVVQEHREVPLGATLVEASRVVCEALHACGLRVEKTDVRGVELDPRPTTPPPPPPAWRDPGERLDTRRT